MPDFVSIETRNICGASRPANTPRQACSLDCAAKLCFAFQPAFAGKAADAKQQAHQICNQHAPFRRQPVNIFQAGFFTEHHTFRSFTTSLPAPAGKQPFAPFFTEQIIASRQLVTSFRLDRPVYFRSHSFYFFFFFHSTLYKKGNRQSRFPSLFLAIPNLVQI